VPFSIIQAISLLRLRQACRHLAVLLFALALASPAHAGQPGTPTPDSAAAAGAGCSVVEVFARQGCPHCIEAKAYLASLQASRTHLVITYFDVEQDRQALQRLLDLSARHNITRPGVPAFLVCGDFSVGYAASAGTPQWLEARLAGTAPAAPEPRVIGTPLGTLSATSLGLPLFTVAVGLIDGFNPCAMWVLLFLLSILVNIRDRGRIALIAGTFVVVSGLVYFAFMAAWLNLFLLIGFTRWLQIVIAVLALAMGAIHLKDFLAPGRGLSLSIPAAAKPGLYSRVRDVMHARNIGGALVAIVLLALMVNAVELLCTAGLPALYTQILSQYELSSAGHYGYLALYNLAYILDDGIMVAIAVVTLNKRKLQQDEGRWLKLASGLVVIALGLLLLLAPQWLF
jgi:glutaredoxin